MARTCRRRTSARTLRPRWRHRAHARRKPRGSDLAIAPADCRPRPDLRPASGRQRFFPWVRRCRPQLRIEEESCLARSAGQARRTPRGRQRPPCHKQVFLGAKGGRHDDRGATVRRTGGSQAGRHGSRPQPKLGELRCSSACGRGSAARRIENLNGSIRTSSRARRASKSGLDIWRGRSIGPSGGPGRGRDSRSCCA